MTSYQVRILPAAERDIAEAHVHFVETAGFAIADEWENGLLEALTELTLTPRRQEPSGKAAFWAGRYVGWCTGERRPAQPTTSTSG